MHDLYSLFLLGAAIAILTAMVDATILVSRPPIWRLKLRQIAVTTGASDRYQSAAPIASDAQAPAARQPVNDMEWHLTA